MLEDRTVLVTCPYLLACLCPPKRASVGVLPLFPFRQLRSLMELDDNPLDIDAFVKAHSLATIPDGDSERKYLPLIRLTPIGLSGRWLCTAQVWKSFDRLCRTQDPLTAEVQFLLSWKERVFKFNRRLQEDLVADPAVRTIAPFAFRKPGSDGKDSSLQGPHAAAFYHGLMETFGLDRFIWASQYMISDEPNGCFPRPSQIPCSRWVTPSTQSTRWRLLQQEWPETITDFGAQWTRGRQAFPTQMPENAAEYDRIILSLSYAYSTADASVHTGKVKANFMLAALAVRALGSVSIRFVQWQLSLLADVR